MKEKKILQIQQYMSEHPILKEKKEYRIAYLSLVECICKKYSGEDIVWEKSILYLMKDIFIQGEKLFQVAIAKNNCFICNPEEVQIFKYIIRKYKYNVLTDCLFIDAFESKSVGKGILSQLEAICTKNNAGMRDLFEMFYDQDNNIIEKKYPALKNIYHIIKKNREYIEFPETKIMITANMSAGKSTLLNALIGKKINKMQNEACTAKVHYLYNKAGEDGVTGKWDCEVNLNASENVLMEDNPKNVSDNIYIGTRFRSLGEIKDKLCFIDTPGVNSSQNKKHQEVTDRVIKDGKCDVLIFVFNGENIGTDDDIYHAKYVFENYHGEIIFLVNKLDKFRKEDSVSETLHGIKETLKEIGYKNPKVYPVSAYGAYLAKQFMYGGELTEDELDEMEYRERKLSREEFRYYQYYDTEIPVIHDENKSEILLRDSGILSLEKMIYEKAELKTIEYMQNLTKKRHRRNIEMRKVKITYNPYRVSTKIEIDGKIPKQNSKLNFGDKRLQEWIDDFPEYLAEEYPADSYEIIFHGIKADYDDVLSAVEAAKKKEIYMEVVEYIPAIELDEKEGLIKKLFEEIQKGPFDDLRSPSVIEAFEKIKNSELEINVLATMSAGKSTLINAMLRQKLMPSKNEACTAIVTRIKDNDADYFSATVYGQNGKPSKKIKKLTLEEMKCLNSDPNVSRIEVDGDIPFTTAENTSLVLVDTPGPNNSRNERHKEITYGMISDQAKPVIIYVMNATQFAVKDDKELLEKIAENTKSGGRQSRDRFIFVVNKLDAFKKGEDNVSKTLQEVKKYLAGFGIENPNIYPVSALAALDIRTILEKSDEEDEDEVWEAEGIVRKFNRRDEMHFETYAPLPKSIKNQIEIRLEDSVQRKDDNMQALIHSGIISLEEAICLYVTKYARLIKIKTVVENVNHKIEEKRTFEHIKNEISKNEKHKKEIERAIERIEEKIESGEEAKRFEKQIEDLNYEKEIVDEIERIKREANKKVIQYSERVRANKSRITRPEAKDMAEEFMEYVNEILANVRVEFNELVEESIQKNQKELVEIYKNKLENLQSEIEIADIEISPLKLMEGDIAMNISYAINSSTRTERVKIGEEWVENTERKWYKPWTWFQEKGHYESVMENREYIDGMEFMTAFLAEPQVALYNDGDTTVKYARAQTKKVKNDFKNKFKKLNEILKEKLEELKVYTKDKEEMEEQLAQLDGNLKWLEDIQSSVDSILDI